MSLLALPFGSERYAHVVYVVDQEIDDPQAVVDAVRAEDPTRSRGTMLSVRIVHRCPADRAWAQHVLNSVRYVGPTGPGRR